MTDVDETGEVSELPVELERAIAAARGDGPSAEDLAAMADGLGPALGTASAGGLAGIGGKLLVIVGGAALVGGAVWFAAGSGKVPPESPSSAPLETAAMNTPPSEPPEERSSKSAFESFTEKGSPPAEPSNTENKEARGESTRTAGRDRLRVDSVVAQSTAADAKQRSIAGQPKAGSPKTSVPSEATLLASARSALKSDPARALRLTQQHRELYPTGVLAQEREVIAIEALRKTGDVAAARSRADNFRAQHPSSIHRQKVETK